MARYAFVLRPCIYNKFTPYYSDYTNTVGTVAKAKAHFKNWVLSVRNLLRNGETYAGLPSFEQVALPSPRYIVSDIGEWMVSSRYYACAFEVRDTIANVSWLFIFNCPDLQSDSSQSGNQFYNIFGGNSSDSVWYKYFQRTESGANPYSGAITTSTSFTSSGKCLLVLYNPQADSQANDFKMNFTWATLTYGGGDFSTVTAPPITDGAATTFMPDHNLWPRGILITSIWYLYSLTHLHNVFNKEIFIFDTENPALVYVNTYRTNYYLYCIFGDIYTPRNVGDTYEQGTHYWVVQTGSDSTLQLFNTSYYGAGLGGHGECLNAAGTRVHVYDYPLKDIFIKSMKDDDGNYIWKELAVKNVTSPAPNYDKGWFKGTAVIECLPFNDINYVYRVVNRPDSNNPMMKFGESTCGVWAPNFLPPIFVWPYDTPNLDTI